VSHSVSKSVTESVSQSVLSLPRTVPGALSVLVRRDGLLGRLVARVIVLQSVVRRRAVSRRDQVEHGVVSACEEGEEEEEEGSE
jgi:hypothetical protein